MEGKRERERENVEPQINFTLDIPGLRPSILHLTLFPSTYTEGGGTLDSVTKFPLQSGRSLSTLKSWQSILILWVGSAACKRRWY